MSSRLLADFPDATYTEWRAAAEALLKGAPFEKRLLTRTPEGLTLEPIQDASALDGISHLASLPGQAPYLRGRTAEGYLTGGWELAQELTEATPAAFNAAALHDLERGQNALTVVVDRATLAGVDPDEARPGEVGRGSMGQGGLSLASLDDLDLALRGIDLTRVPVYLQAPSAAVPLLALFVGLARRRQLDPGELKGGVEMDPLGALAAEGRYLRSLPGAYDRMAQVVTWAAEHAPGLTAVTVHGQPWAEGGAHAVQELAFVTATTAEYLRELALRGVEADVAAPRMRLSLSVGSNLLMEVAKIRAARLIHARIVHAFGGSEAAQQVRIHARTARFNRSVLDPYVNLLRGTTGAFSAVLGGVDSLHVGCWDELIRTPDANSRRMARNTQLVLREESHLTGVIDPMGGAWYGEHLTDQVARAAWDLFVEIERQGGMGTALAEGHPQAQVQATLEARRARSAKRKDVQVGVNMYADATESPATPAAADPAAVDPAAERRAREVAAHRTGLENGAATRVMERLAAVLDAPDAEVMEALVSAAAAGASLGELARTLRRGDETVTRATPVPAVRQAEPFETVRRRVADHVESGGERPRVFLAKLGPVGQHKARAEFTTGFMEVGGFAVEGDRGFDSPDEAGRAAAASGAPVIAICSTDDTYAELVAPLVAALRAAASAPAATATSAAPTTAPPAAPATAPPAAPATAPPAATATAPPAATAAAPPATTASSAATAAPAQPTPIVLLAGCPPDQVAALQEAGVDDFVYLGADAVELHTRLLDRMGIAS